MSGGDVQQQGVRHKPAATKWGGAVSSGRYGYQLVPDVLLRQQQAVGINCTELAVLVNITMHWWESDREKWPHPRCDQIARRIGASPRTVQRCIGRMSKLGLMKLLPAEQTDEGLRFRRIDLSGLVLRLEELANGAAI